MQLEATNVSCSQPTKPKKMLKLVGHRWYLCTCGSPESPNRCWRLIAFGFGRLIFPSKSNIFIFVHRLTYRNTWSQSQDTNDYLQLKGKSYFRFEIKYNFKGNSLNIFLIFIQQLKNTRKRKRWRQNEREDMQQSRIIAF